MYHVIDHIHRCPKLQYSTEYEATKAAFRLAEAQTVCADNRVHLSVMDGQRQAIEISIKQREGDKQ